jgi:bacterioferritin (cytochrome b1)
MQVTERELWLLNFYRNSELHGALLMGKLARSFTDTELLVNLTKHCATEAHHAALLSQAIASLRVRLDPRVETIQDHYSSAGGIPKELPELLVLSETLEKRVLKSYRAHLQRDDVHPVTRETLTKILLEMEKEDDGEHGGWIERTLEKLPAKSVKAAEAKWRAIDEQVAAGLTTFVNTKFPKEAVCA